MQVTNPSQVDLPHLDLHTWLYWGIFGRFRVFNRFSCLLGGPSFLPTPPKLKLLQAFLFRSLLAQRAALPARLTAGRSALGGAGFPGSHSTTTSTTAPDLLTLRSSFQLPWPTPARSHQSYERRRVPPPARRGDVPSSARMFPAQRMAAGVPPCQALASAPASSPPRAPSRESGGAVGSPSARFRQARRSVPPFLQDRHLCAQHSPRQGRGGDNKAFGVARKTARWCLPRFSPQPSWTRSSCPSCRQVPAAGSG